MHGLTMLRNLVIVFLQPPAGPCWLLNKNTKYKVAGNNFAAVGSPKPTATITG